VGDRWERIGWDRTLAEIGARVKQIRRDHGPDSIAMYVGTAAGFGVLHPVFAQGFMTAIGSRSMYSSATQDCANKFAVAREMYGFPFTQPFPDLERTGCLIIVGANPVVSKWSFLQVPNPVALPHGWGHQHATGLSVASRTRGVNVNLLAADGPERIERVSGMAHLTGMLVDVRPAAGPQDPSSWSGLPPVPGTT
jgi:anaerobic selenocysteine-containing dehydrogenase